MTEEKPITETEIRAALSELNELCRDEYGIELEELITDPAPLSATRLQRLTGIVLKQKFATPSQAPIYSETGARRAWPWKDGSPEASATGAERELELLNQLRMPGSWNERKPLSGTDADRIPVPWDTFKDDVENERGLFKIVALYVADKIDGRKRKTLKEYLKAEESRRFEAGLDLAVLLSDAAVIGPLASVLGVPTLVVGIGLVGIQFGYRVLTDPVKGRKPESTN